MVARRAEVLGAGWVFSIENSPPCIHESDSAVSTLWGRGAGAPLPRLRGGGSAQGREGGGAPGAGRRGEGSEGPGGGLDPPIPGMRGEGVPKPGFWTPPPPPGTPKKGSFLDPPGGSKKGKKRAILVLIPVTCYSLFGLF